MIIEKRHILLLLAFIVQVVSESTYALATPIPQPTLTIQGESVTLTPVSPPIAGYAACYAINDGTKKGFEYWPDYINEPSICIQVSTGLSQVRLFNLGIAPVYPLPPDFDPHFTLEVSGRYAGATTYNIGAMVAGFFHRGLGQAAEGSDVSLLVKAPEHSVEEGPVSQEIKGIPSFSLGTGVSAPINCLKPGHTVPCDDTQVTQFYAKFKDEDDMIIFPNSLNTVSCENGELCRDRLQQLVAEDQKLLQRGLAPRSVKALIKADRRKTCEGICLTQLHVVFIVLIGVIVGILVAFGIRRMRRA